MKMEEKRHCGILCFIISGKVKMQLKCKKRFVHKDINIEQCNKIESPEINLRTLGHLMFDKGAKICNGEKTISLISGAGKTVQPLVKE